MYKKIIVTPADECITLDKLSTYERCNAITQRITMLKHNPELYTENIKNLLINVDQIEEHKKVNIRPEDIIIDGNQSFVKLSSTRDIAKFEYNQGKSPFSIMRILSETEKEVYVEIYSVNDLVGSVLPYLSQYDF